MLLVLWIFDCAHAQSVPKDRATVPKRGLVGPLSSAHHISAWAVDLRHALGHAGLT
jgi:hypothetical protein